MTNDHKQDRLDRVVADRLAMLASRPVSTERIEARFEAIIREPGIDQHTSSPRRRIPRRWQTIASAAAVALVVLTIGWFMFNRESNLAVAAPIDLAQIHFNVSRGLTPYLTVSNVEEANRVLAEQADGARLLPLELPGQIMSCCLQEYAGTTLSCVLIEQNGQLITVALADGAMMHSPEGETITRNGRNLTAHRANGINMVMANQSDRWLCVMGDVPIDDLVAVAALIDL